MYFSIKAIRFNKFYFRNFGHHLLKHFFLEHRRLEDVYQGTPSQDRARRETEARFGLIGWNAFLKKRKATLTTTENRLQVLKVREIFVSFFKVF